MTQLSLALPAALLICLVEGPTSGQGITNHTVEVWGSKLPDYLINHQLNCILSANLIHMYLLKIVDG